MTTERTVGESMTFNYHTLPKHQAFDRLAAEHEQAWLGEVFVDPPDFESLARMRSTVVFGACGAGKTALRLALARRAIRAGSGMIPLVVDWRPSVSVDLMGSRSQALQALIAQVLNACAQALLRYLGQRPDAFGDAPNWVKETTIWFIHRYLSGDRSVFLERLAEECKPEGVALVSGLLERNPRPVLETGASEVQAIVELAGLTERLGLGGVLVLVDGLESWIEADVGSPSALLHALLSTLALFEDPGFVMKLLLPDTIEAALISSGGLARRRLDVYRLAYSESHLIGIIERRIAIAVGRAPFHLAELCDTQTQQGTNALTAWLSRCGGQAPRAWLNLVRPLADAYIEQGRTQPLTLKECAEIFRSRPPMLRMDLATGRVFVGEGELTNLAPTAFKLLRYLYIARRLCTRSELYYRVCRDLSTEPRSCEDTGWEEPNSWSETFDTILWRLRKQIELDLKTPLYIITDRGKGVRLENVW